MEWSEATAEAFADTLAETMEDMLTDIDDDTSVANEAWIACGTGSSAEVTAAIRELAAKRVAELMTALRKRVPALKRAVANAAIDDYHSVLADLPADYLGDS